MIVKRSYVARQVDAMIAATRTAPLAVAAATIRGRSFLPPLREPEAPPAPSSSWHQEAMERLMGITMKARLSGVDRQVLDAVVLKVLCGRRGCVQGLVTVQTIARAIGRTEQAVRLSIKRLVGLGILSVSRGARGRPAVVQIHQAILHGRYDATPVDNYSQERGPAKRIFRGAGFPSPPRTPTSHSTTDVFYCEPPAQTEKGDAAPVARPANTIWTDAWPTLAASGAALRKTPPNHVHNEQGIQERNLSPPLRWSG